MGHVAYVIPDDLHQRARVAATQQGRTFKAFLERALLAAVEEHETAEEKRRRGR